MGTNKQKECLVELEDVLSALIDALDGYMNASEHHMHRTPQDYQTLEKAYLQAKQFEKEHWRK